MASLPLTLTLASALTLAVAARPQGDADSAAAADGAAPRIIDRVDLPLVYLSFGGLDGEPTAAGGSESPSATTASRLLECLTHPAATQLLGDAPALGPALSILERFFARPSGEPADGESGDIELALTGIDTDGQPELIFRGRLGTADAEAVARVLAAAPVRGFVAGTSIHALPSALEAGSPDSPPSSADAGFAASSIEVVLAGRELIVANHRRGIQQLLGRRTTTSRPLARHPVYERLRRSLPAEPGDLTVFVDWPRFSARLSGVTGIHGSLLGWSGLGRTAGLLAAVRVSDNGFATTALVDREGFRSPRARDGDQGWANLLQTTSLRNLARGLPRGGVAAVMLAADPAGLAESGAGGSSFSALRRAMTSGCSGMGLSFDNQVLRRLAGTGAVQLVMVPAVTRDADGATVDLHPVWSLRARNRASAVHLFDDLRRAVVQAKLGQLISERGRIERLQIGGAGAEPGRHRGRRHFALFGGQPLFVAVAGDSLVVAHESAAVDAAFEAAVRGRGGANLWSEWAAAGFDRNADDAAGLIYADLSVWLEAANSGEVSEGLPTRHLGVVRVLDDHLRLEVVSPR